MPRLDAIKQKLPKEEQRLTLSDQESYPNSRHVEPIQPRLHVISAIIIPGQPEAHAWFNSFRPLPFQDPLRNSSDRWIMSAFDGF